MISAEPPPPTLGALGISAAEESAYELLIDLGPGTEAELAVAWTRPEQLGAVLARLEDKGLVLRSAGRPPRLTAAAPDVALDALLADHEQRLRRSKEHAERLVATYRQGAPDRDPGSIIEVVMRAGAARKRLAQILLGARHEIRCLDIPPYLDRHGTEAAERELLTRGVTCRTIYDRDSVEHPQALPSIEELIHAGQQAKVLPDLPLKLYLVDDRFAVLPWAGAAGPAEEIIIVHSSALLDALGNLFEALWHRSLPLDLLTTQPRTSRGEGAAAADKRLVALLLSGLTDRSIARQLGMGHRTVQRRIAALIDDLGVHTRFQAGVQAALREATWTERRLRSQEARGIAPRAPGRPETS